MSSFPEQETVEINFPGRTDPSILEPAVITLWLLPAINQTIANVKLFLSSQS